MPKNIEKNQKNSNDKKRNFLKNKKLHFSKFQKMKMKNFENVQKLKKSKKFTNLEIKSEKNEKFP